MTLRALAAALQERQSSPPVKNSLPANVSDLQRVGFYTRCGRCGKALFMDDSLIVEQCNTAEQFLERCAKRLFEHRCGSDSTPHV